MSSNTVDEKFSVSSNSNAHLDPNSSYTPNDSQLAGLVEAATAAASAGHDIQQWTAASALSAASNQQLDGYTADIHLGDDGFGDANFSTPMGNTRNARNQNDHAQNSGLTRTGTKKRKRNDDNLDPALAGAGITGSQQHSAHYSQPGSQGYNGDNIDVHAAPPQSLPEAPAGVHSAAALFRQPSTNKKHTRPPMSKLFSSLELSPENFLYLQAAAKAYMLDDQYPERRDCVGQRGKGDTEMVKLRLLNCVRTFLEAEGNGERFFGEHVVNEGMGPRTYIWPRDQQKIISLVVPLLRRMVTNERQRRYAIETRKGGGDDRRRTQSNEAFPQLPQFSPDHSNQLNSHDTRSHEFTQTMPPPPPPMAQGPTQSVDPNQAIDVGFADLLGGSHMDWAEISKTYDMFNRDLELDNLWSLSGLQQPEWRGLVAAVDNHFHVVHDGEYSACSGPCEDHYIDHIIHSDSTSNLPWRIGGVSNSAARDDFARSITRDVSRIVRDNATGRHDGQQANSDQAQIHHHHHHHHHHQPPPIGSLPSAPSISTSASPSTTNTDNQTYLHVNILQQGKRILPRFDIPAGQFPNIDLVKQAILRRYAGQIPNTDKTDSLDQTMSWSIKVWLPEGLTQVGSSKDWAVALLTADTVDWMDGIVKVLVDIEGSI